MSVMPRAFCRDSYRRPKLMMFDGRVSLLLLGVLLHPRLYTLIPAVTAIIMLYFIEIRHHMDVESALRVLRSKLAGRRRPGHPSSSRRRSIDYGRFGHRL